MPKTPAEAPPQDSDTPTPAPAKVGGRAKSITMRRQPSQERGHATIDTVLQAAGAEIEEGGLDRLTTKRIAARAGLSVGAVYEYFPNKETIVCELVKRWMARIFKAVDEVHPRHGQGMDMLTYLTAQAEGVILLYEDQPGLGALLHMLNAMPAVREVSDAHDQAVLNSVTSALVHYLPRVDPAELRAAALSILLVSDVMLSAAVVYRTGDRQRLLTNMRVCQMAIATRLLTTV